MIDTGASCSLMDIGTIDKLGFNKHVDQQTHHHLIDASGNNMKIIGTVLSKLKSSETEKGM